MEDLDADARDRIAGELARPLGWSQEQEQAGIDAWRQSMGW